MKRVLITIVTVLITLSGQLSAYAEKPDSVYIFTYAIPSDSHKGLHKPIA